MGHKAIELWFFQGCLDLARTLPGAEEALRAISQVYRLGVITNGLEYRQRAKFESLPIHELFDVFLTSEAAGVEKPSSEIFLLALGRAGVLPSEAAFVGDRLDVDVLGAQQAGMTAIWVDHQGRVPSGSGPEPDATFTDFGELPSILLQLEAKQTVLAEVPNIPNVPILHRISFCGLNGAGAGVSCSDYSASIPAQPGPGCAPQPPQLDNT